MIGLSPRINLGENIAKGTMDPRVECFHKSKGSPKSDYVVYVRPLTAFFIVGFVCLVWFGRFDLVSLF